MNDRQFQKPGNTILIFGWILYGFVILTEIWGGIHVFLFPKNFMIPCLFGHLAILGSIILVGIDASRIKVKELEFSTLELTTVNRMGVAGWVVGCILFWILFLPMYLIKRNKLADFVLETIENNLYMTPVEKIAFQKKANRRSLIFGLVVLGILISGVIILVFGFPV